MEKEIYTFEFEKEEIVLILIAQINYRKALFERLKNEEDLYLRKTLENLISEIDKSKNKFIEIVNG